MIVSITLEIPDPKFGIETPIIITNDWERKGQKGVVKQQKYIDLTSDPANPNITIPADRWQYRCLFEDGSFGTYSSGQIDKQSGE